MVVVCVSVLLTYIFVLFSQVTTKNPCGSKTCTCRKYGMPCLSACGECRGTECTNIETVSMFKLLIQLIFAFKLKSQN